MSIKSIQRGFIDFSSDDYATDTITSVDVDNSVIRFLGCVGQAAGTVNDASIWIYLDDATTVVGQRYRDGATTGKVSYEVVEYN